MTYYESLSISNSSLSVFNHDPSYFYKVHVTKELEDKKESDAMLLGSIIHCMLLEPEEFDNRYFTSSVLPNEMPSGMMLEYVKALAEQKVEDELSFEFAYAKSGYKISREKVLENFNKVPGYRTYLQELKDPRQVVSTAMMETAKLNVENVKASPYWHRILGNLKWKEEKELEIYWNTTVTVDGEEYALPLKSKLDHLFVHYDEEFNLLSLRYFDYKTDSQKPVHKYQDSFEYWKTYRQFAFYWLAMREWARQNYPKADLDISMYVVPIDVVRNKTVTYEVKRSYLVKGMEEIDKNLRDLAWHMTNNLWEYPKDIYLQDIPALVPLED